MLGRTANVNIEYENVSEEVKLDVKDVIADRFDILADHGKYLNTKPFEENESNAELVEETIETLESKVRANIELKTWENGDQKSNIDYIYKIHVK